MVTLPAEVKPFLVTNLLFIRPKRLKFIFRDLTWSPKIILRKLDEKFPLWSQKLNDTQFVYDAKFDENGKQIVIANLSQCKRSDIEIRILSAKDGTCLHILDIIFPFKGIKRKRQFKSFSVISIGYEFIALGGRDNVLLLNTKNLKEQSQQTVTTKRP